MHGTGENPLEVCASATACLTVSEPVGIPNAGLLLLSHPLPGVQIRPVMGTTASRPEIAAVPIVTLPVPWTDEAGALSQADCELGSTYEQATA
jgi:hypothetical protein